MSDVPHRPAAFINAINEEGTKAEAIEYLQQTWNELCEARARIRELEAAVEGLVDNEDPAWDPIAFYNARATLATITADTPKEMHTESRTEAAGAERDRLREALETIAQTKPHHAGQTRNEYHFQQIARAALAGGE